ncbi:M61 family metallopeptidase [Algoriphagus mannitolivorans]|uniref:M61 family metallopeptidase n=1 Tax=Algoriphagus mannitolivorans TaxID=226504 RepID=UPI000688B80B|nr:M61 family metallopeptidase [Algoriphagus mannitolivorans]
MIHYSISCSYPASQFVNIRLDLKIPDSNMILLQLPAWRAGRYQLANYAQNIRKIEAFDPSGLKLEIKKLTKDLWEIQNSEQVSVHYEYWAGKMDAGNSWVDEEQVYLNLVNCCFEVVGHSEEKIKLTLDLPLYPDQITTLPKISSGFWQAQNFQQLADSTVLASKELKHWAYSCLKTQFHIWIQGEVCFEKEVFLENFRQFTEKLISDFGEFPEEEYHFIFQLLPYSHYHGVEHRRGTVITFGPAESLNQDPVMEELLGVSCHELYHAWNVCRIRPKELLPYNFSQETYTQAGLILEGVTTYMGDLYLLKSGVYDLSTYLKHLEKVIQRELDSFGWRNQSIAESSFDLWLDGYVPGIPDKKVSIYTRGAILAMGLDAMLIESGSSLPKVMKKMWDRFGKPILGYAISDFQEIILEELQDQKLINRFFSSYVNGHLDYFPDFKKHLKYLGLNWKEEFEDNPLLHEFGIRINDQQQILQIHPESPSFKSLMKGDIILESNLENLKEAYLEINRQGRALLIHLEHSDELYFPKVKLSCPKILESTKIWIG